MRCLKWVKAIFTWDVHILHLRHKDVAPYNSQLPWTENIASTSTVNILSCKAECATRQPSLCNLKASKNNVVFWKLIPKLVSSFLLRQAVQRMMAYKPVIHLFAFVTWRITQYLGYFLQALSLTVAARNVSLDNEVPPRDLLFFFFFFPNLNLLLWSWPLNHGSELVAWHIVCHCMHLWQI